jgi:hypothetical protein
VGRCQPPPCRCLRLDQNQNSFCEKCYTTIKLSSSAWTFSCWTLGVLSNRTRQTGSIKGLAKVCCRVRSIRLTVRTPMQQLPRRRR